MLNKQEIAQIEHRLRTTGDIGAEVTGLDRLIRAIREYDLAYRTYFYGDIIANLKDSPPRAA